MTIVVDFDGTLALGNASHITSSVPNFKLINQLKELKQTINPYVKIVTARGAKGKLTNDEKIKKYKHLIAAFLDMYHVPYDEISFNKEYADLYVDDMTISQFANFSGTESYFTRNKIIFTEHTVIKKCKTALFEKQWYELARAHFNVPEVLFLNDETIITSRINNVKKPSVKDVIDIIERFRGIKTAELPFQTYQDRIVIPKTATPRVSSIISELRDHPATFFHGDLSTSNILKTNDCLWLIDPNFKNVFGSYLTDAGKAFFSFIAYEHSYESAEQISNHFGPEVVKWAVAEGLRVTKYREEYISIVNNIADLI
jgi:tRNA A-37 threonylcarbamoyl transferase component Bud32